MHQRLHRFVIIVGNVETPAAVHRLAGFERHFGRGFLVTKPRFVFAGKITLEHLKIFSWYGRKMVIVADHTFWLQLMYEAIDLFILPVDAGVAISMTFRIGLVPMSIKPDAHDIAVVGKQFRQLV